MNTIIAFAVGLFIGCCFGVLVAGVLTIERNNDDMEEAQTTIRKQAKVIKDQGMIINELNHQLDGMEDDGK